MNRTPRTPEPSQSIGHWLRAEPALRALVESSATLLRLQHELVRNCGEPDLVVLRLQGGTLTVQAPSAAVAAKLRQRAPSLCSHMSKSGWQVVALKVKPRLAAPAAEARAIERRELPGSALTALDQLRAAVNDADLRASLARMIDRHRRAPR